MLRQGIKNRLYPTNVGIMTKIIDRRDMKVSELIAELQKLPPDISVEVNNNRGGECYEIEQVDHFEANEYDPELVMLQVNADY